MEPQPEFRSARKPTIIFAVGMIAAGIVLFLGNLGLFPVYRIWDLWPLIFAFMGFGRLAGGRTPGRILQGIAFVVVGVVATLFTTGLFHLRYQHDDNAWISLVLILVGVVGLAKVLDGEAWYFADHHQRRWARHQRRMTRGNWGGGSSAFEDAAGQSNYADTDPVLNDRTVMGHIKRSVQSQSFQGGRLACVLGNIEIDLRRTKIVDGQTSVRIDVDIIMGHVALRVPDSWRVIWNGDNFLGNFEDKTIPPNTGLSAPELMLTGSCTMGSLEIES